MASVRHMISVLLLCGVEGSLRGKEKPVTATGMAGLEGNPCPDKELYRYQEIVCRTIAACECGEGRCALDWCSDYVHDWKKKFGACSLEECTGGQAPILR